MAGEIQKGPLEKVVEKELSLLKEVGGKILTLKDDDYPKRLKEIYDPPPLLYVRGELRRRMSWLLPSSEAERPLPMEDGSQKR